MAFSSAAFGNTEEGCFKNEAPPGSGRSFGEKGRYKGTGMIKESFNRGWKFERSGGSAFAALMGGGAEKETVDLPHDASIHEKRDPNEPNGSGNGFFHENNYVYSKEFVPSGEEKDKIWTLEFEGVYQNAYVYVNNAFAVRHPYGYGNFYVDITNYLEWDVTNTVKVVVKNGVPSGRWYTGGGIYRDVHLMKADRLHFAADGVRISVEELEEDLAVIRAESEVDFCGMRTEDAVLHMELLNDKGETVAEDELPFTIQEGERNTYRQRLFLHNPICWDAETPYLYHYRASIWTGEAIRDSEEGSFGVRKLCLDPVHGFRVNGKEVKLRGGCLHHDNGVIGTAEFSHAEEVRVKNLKAAGFNAIRSSHYPMSRKLLEACDRLGMYVMDEFSDVWTTTKVDFDYGMEMPDWWELDVANLVRKDYNHPCVILYSIGNEIPETGNRLDVQWGKKLADKIRRLDDTRFVTNSMNLMLSVMNDLPKQMAGQSAEGERGSEINEMMTDLGALMAGIVTSDFVTEKTKEASGQVDVTGLNYAAQRYEMDHRLRPNRILVGSETYPMDLDTNWALVEKYPNIIGDFDWTAYDYLGEAGIGKISYNAQKQMSFYAPYPCRAAYCGDLNLLGDARPVAFWRKTIWGLQGAPYIAVCPPEHHQDIVVKSQWAMTDAVRSWNWKGYEGKPVRIEVYSDAEEIELWVNGECIERQQVGNGTEDEMIPRQDATGRFLHKKNTAVFETVYRPGKLEAVAYRNGEETGRDLLRTADDHVEMKIFADRSQIPADGSDICYVELELADQEGIRNPGEVRSISVCAEGAGYILGFGSADPESEENFDGSVARTYEGRLRAAVRAKEKGTIKVTFRGEGMKEQTVSILAV